MSFKDVPARRRHDSRRDGRRYIWKMENKESKNPEKLVEGVDYYFENGLMVLTAHFLKKRGYCCGNGCRHCPYSGEEKNTRNLL